MEDIAVGWRSQISGLNRTVLYDLRATPLIFASVTKLASIIASRKSLRAIIYITFPNILETFSVIIYTTTFRAKQYSTFHGPYYKHQYHPIAGPILECSSYWRMTMDHQLVEAYLPLSRLYDISQNAIQNDDGSNPYLPLILSFMSSVPFVELYLCLPWVWKVQHLLFVIYEAALASLNEPVNKCVL